MQLEIPLPQLKQLLARQLGALFVFDSALESECLDAAIETAVQKCDFCFQRIPNKYYRRETDAYFNPFHSGQYSIYLYFVSRAIWEGGDAPATLADRVYYLNKALNGLDLFYEVAMPAVFFCDHPVGTVIGRGTFGNGFSFGQNSTVGNNKGIYPVFGDNVNMYSGAKVIGRSNIGDNVVIGADTYIKDQDVPADSLVFGASPNLVIKPRR